MNNEFIDPKYLDLSFIPEDIKISTISATCSLGVNLLLPNIYKYLKLSKDGIYTIKYDNKIKSLELLKKKKKVQKSFQNQMTVEINPDLIEYPLSKISVKIFKNGSIQMSGIKNIKACNNVLKKLVTELERVLAIIENNNIREINFIENNEKIVISKFKIDMINSGFELKYEIDREIFYNVLLEKNIECKFEPSIHAGVNIKYLIDNELKKVSVFVFESGSIIITGAKTIDNIVKTYEFISDFINKNKFKIKKNKISSILNSNYLPDELKNIINIDNDDSLLELALKESLVISN